MPVSSLQLEAEAKIPEAAKFYCPQRDCSNLLIVKKTTHAEVECSACQAYLCTICRGFGHSGMSCAEAKVSLFSESFWLPYSWSVISSSCTRLHFCCRLSVCHSLAP